MIWLNLSAIPMYLKRHTPPYLLIPYKTQPCIPLQCKVFSALIPYEPASIRIDITIGAIYQANELMTSFTHSFIHSSFPVLFRSFIGSIIHSIICMPVCISWTSRFINYWKILWHIQNPVMGFKHLITIRNYVFIRERKPFVSEHVKSAVHICMHIHAWRLNVLNQYSMWPLK